jgi:fucose 4-O-acetylase-like acetyltransferase
MMWAFVIFYALIEFVLDDLKKIAAVIIALLVVQFLICYFIDVGLFMGLKEVPIAAAFMFLGFVLSKYNLIDTIEKMELRTKAFWLPFLVCLIAGLVLCFILHPGTGFDKASFGYLGAASVFPFFVEAGLMCIVYIYIAAFVAKIPVLSKALEICGQHTMGILLYHGSIATAIFALFAPLSFDSWFPTLDFTTRLVIGIVTFVLCVIICVYGPKLITAFKDKKKDKVSS